MLNFVTLFFFYFFLLLFNHLATKDPLWLLFVVLLFVCFSRALLHCMHLCPFSCRPDETHNTNNNTHKKKKTSRTMFELRIIENCFGSVSIARQKRTLFENDHSKNCQHIETIKCIVFPFDVHI